jgi:uridine kinase
MLDGSVVTSSPTCRLGEMVERMSAGTVVAVTASPAAGRNALLSSLADEIAALPAAPYAQVAVDGVDGAGKTVFADGLTELLLSRGFPVVRASIDGFHNPRVIRYARGKNSPLGFYRDSHDLEALRRELLFPLAQAGDGCYRCHVFDVQSNAPDLAPLERAAPGSVLVIDGIFLHRPELVDYWNWSVWLEVDRSVSLARCVIRDGTGSPDPSAEENRRYVEGQRLYVDESAPQRRASHVIDNNDFDSPHLIR